MIVANNKRETSGFDKNIENKNKKAALQGGLLKSIQVRCSAFEN